MANSIASVIRRIGKRIDRKEFIVKESPNFPDGYFRIMPRKKEFFKVSTFGKLKVIFRGRNHMAYKSCIHVKMGH